MFIVLQSSYDALLDRKIKAVGELNESLREKNRSIDKLESEIDDLKIEKATSKYVIGSEFWYLGNRVILKSFYMVYNSNDKIMIIGEYYDGEYKKLKISLEVYEEAIAENDNEPVSTIERGD